METFLNEKYQKVLIFPNIDGSSCNQIQHHSVWNNLCGGGKIIINCLSLQFLCVSSIKQQLRSNNQFAGGMRQIQHQSRHELELMDQERY